MTNPIEPISDEQLAELEARLLETQERRYSTLMSHEWLSGLIARLRAAEADAKRYRWLAASSWYVGPPPTDEENGYRSNDENWNTGRLSTAIDAAMERKP